MTRPRERPRMVVRARARGDLEQLKLRYLPGSRAPILVTPERDYPYRILITRHAWVRVIAAIAEDVSYTNFKDAVALHQGHRRASIYHRVWATMMDVTREGETP